MNNHRSPSDEPQQQLKRYFSFRQQDGSVTSARDEPQTQRQSAYRNQLVPSPSLASPVLNSSKPSQLHVCGKARGRGERVVPSEYPRQGVGNVWKAYQIGPKGVIRASQSFHVYVFSSLFLVTTIVVVLFKGYINSHLPAYPLGNTALFNQSGCVREVC